MSDPVKKIDILLGHIAAGDWDKAIALASRFPRFKRPESKDRIKGAHEAFARPDFQRELGKDIEELISMGKASLMMEYGAALVKRQKS